MPNHDHQITRHNHPPPWFVDLSTCPSACPVRATGALPPPSEIAAGTDSPLAQAQAEEERRSGLAGHLEAWWLDKAQDEIQGVVPKAVEYSSTDLVDLGRQIAGLAGWGDECTDAHHAELGIAFYVAGKVGRIMGAIKEGRLPSDDTWHDIAVYTKMAQRVREVGAWPGV